MKQDHRPTPYEFETGMYRPPSEGGSASLLLRITRNCPWNLCTFCAMYKSEKFELRNPADILREITIMHTVYLKIKAISITQGHHGRITRDAIARFINTEPGLCFHPGMSMLFNWLAAGGKTVFLQDADSLIMPTDHLIQVLTRLKTSFPTIERITTYARSRTLARKKTADLEKIHEAGLDRLHIGLESGDGALLKKIKKGATPQDHVNGGRKAMAAGFQVSEYWMPGLGGKCMSTDHAASTADILNQINPHYIRSRPFTPRPGTIFYDRSKKDPDRLNAREQLMEIRQTLGALTVTSRVCFDHAGNGWTDPHGRLLLSQRYEGYPFPEKKDPVLALLDAGISCFS